MTTTKVFLHIFSIFMTNIGNQIDVSATNYCSFETICNDTIAQNYSLYSKVCKPCFCSGECSTETVCPLFDNIDGSFEECRYQLSFIDQSDLQNETVNKDLVNFPTSYFVVFKCPPDADIELTAACESINDTEDNIYVSSETTYRIYKNKYCAQCNGENNYVTWRKTVVVSSDYLQSIISDINTEPEIITQMIEMFSISIPPSTHEYPENTNVCENNVIKQCNVTGNWIKYDINLVKLCGSSKFPLVSLGRIYYRNVYCILCNQFQESFCEYANDREIPGGQTSSVLRVLQWDEDLLASFKNRRRDESVHACRNNQIVDPLQGGCINVTCPLGHVSINGICEEGTLLGGTTIYFPLTFRLFEPSSEMLLLDWTQNQFSKGECNFCTRRRCSDDHYLCTFRGAFTINTECNITRLISVFQELEYTLPRQKEFKIFGSAAFNATFVRNIKLEQYKNDGCPGDIELWQNYYCSSIVMTSDILSKLETLGLSDDIYDVSEPLIQYDNEIQVNTTSRVICLSDYKRIIQKSGSNGIASIHVDVSDVAHIHMLTHVSFLCAVLFVKR